jgi:hypothetical protein
MEPVVVLIHALRQLLRSIGAQTCSWQQKKRQQQYAHAY